MMKDIILSLMLTSLLVLNLSFSKADEITEAERAVVLGNTKLSSRILSILESESGNYVFSPLSLHAILSVLYQGSSGTTSETLARVLNVPEPETTAQGYHEVMKRFQNAPNLILDIANKIYVKNGAKLVENFKNIVVSKYLSEIENVDFSSSGNPAQVINSWVKEKTHNKIEKLFEEIDSDTSAVLVNALYFKGNWLNPFSNLSTIPRTFYLNDKDEIKVPIMSLIDDFNYKEDADLDAKILELPYENRDFSMIVILPNTNNGIVNLLPKLSKVDLTELTTGLQEHNVALGLPKFKIEKSFDLKTILTQLGLGEIFDSAKSKIGGIIEGENLVVSAAVQKAFIEVNEQGAEAGASTGVGMTPMAARPMKFFLVDHPFLFILKSKPTNEILFLGKVTNPQ